jgi:hypothetical protein
VRAYLLVLYAGGKKNLQKVAVYMLHIVDYFLTRTRRKPPISGKKKEAETPRMPKPKEQGRPHNISQKHRLRGSGAHVIKRGKGTSAMY